MQNASFAESLAGSDVERREKYDEKILGTV
jgi:hypothetical protein